LAVGAAWPSGWVDAGLTLEPSKVTYSYDKLDIKVQQELGPVRRIRTAEDLMLESVLAQLSTGLLALAFAGETTTTAAATGVPGYETFTIGGKYNLPIRMWGLEGSYVDETNVERAIRVIIWQATSDAGGELSFARDAVAGIPLKLSALPDFTQPKGARLMKIIRVTEDAL
jgi:hypothetical protein